MDSTFSLPLAGLLLQGVLDGAVFWREEATLIVADLHLEKGSSFAAPIKPRFLPPYDTRATIDRLERLFTLYAPKRMICLGDSFHDRDAASRMDAADAARIAAMTSSCDWIWIAGNHDPAPSSQWGGSILREIAIGGIVFRHRADHSDLATGNGEVSGHFHPTAAVATRATRISGRCFASDGKRLLLPAFGAYAGGLNVLDPAISGLFGLAFTVVMLGRRRMFAFSSAQLSP